MLRQRIITAMILLALFLAALFLLPAAGWIALVIVMVMQGTLEWARLAKLPGNAAKIYWWLTLALMGGIAWFYAGHALARHTTAHMLIYSVSLLQWLVVAPFWLGMGWKTSQPQFMALIGWIVLIPTGLAMMDLREDSPWLLLGIMALTWVADSAAYFAGRRFGKTKLAPSISPNKTWEGVIGALLGVSVYVAAAWSVYVVVMQDHGAHSQMPVSLPGILLVSLCFVGLAVEGDLFESAIKRQAGVKDSGQLLPGHGGLLDRIDALTSTLPLAALLLLIQRMA